MTALGRQELWEDSPEGYPQSRPYKWWNWHDSYVPGAAIDPEWDRGFGRGRGCVSQGRRRQVGTQDVSWIDGRLSAVEVGGAGCGLLDVQLS